MTSYPDTHLLPVTRQILECLRTAAAENPSPPSIVGFRTGTAGQVLAGLLEDECCGGAAFVRVVRAYPTWGVPAVSATSFGCAQPKGAEIELSMWRCAKIGNMEEPPTQADWDCLHVDLLNDRLTLIAAACCFIRLRDKDSVVLGEWTPVPVEGGCVGSVMSIQVDLFGGNR